MSRLYLKKTATGPYAEALADRSRDVQMEFVLTSVDNPTEYVSEHTWSIVLPRCSENQRFFDEFHRLDSMIQAGGYTPTEKMPYVLTDDAGMTLSTGEAVIDSIDDSGYHLQLVGSQAMLFRKLMNSGYDYEQSLEDDTYGLLDDFSAIYSGMSPLAMNAALVAASWLIPIPLWTLDELRSRFNQLKTEYGITESDITPSMCFAMSIVGFAPTAQGILKNFDGETWIDDAYPESSNSSVTFMPVLHKLVNDEITATVDGATIECQMGEYRSYMQQPYVYVWRLFELYQRQFSDLTGGYTLVLDSRWFNSSNEELFGMVYMLPKVIGDEQVQLGTSHGASFNARVELPEVNVSSSVEAEVVPDLSSSIVTASYNTGSWTADGGERVTIDVNLGITIDPFYYNDAIDTVGEPVYFNTLMPLIVTLEATALATSKKEYVVIPLPDDGRLTFDEIHPLIKDIIMKEVGQYGRELLLATYTPPRNGAVPTLNLTTQMNVVLPMVPSDVTLTAKAHFLFNNAPFMVWNHDRSTCYYYYGSRAGAPMVMNLNVAATFSRWQNERSGSIITLQRIFGSVKPFEILLQYAKAHHLVWLVDDEAATVTVKRAKDYYDDCLIDGTTDITEVVDKGRGLTVTPLSWKDREVVMNMAPMGCDYVEGYKDRYGRDYGSKTIVTRSRLNDSTVNLLGNGKVPAVKGSAMLSESVFNAAVLRSYSGVSMQPVENYPMPLNVSDGETADCYGTFYYRRSTNGLWNKKISEGMRLDAGGAFVMITDDTPLEVAAGRYCWHGPAVTGGIKMYARPVLRTVSENGTSLLFAEPREQYTSDPDQATSYLYDVAWADYIEEVYNEQNKTVAVYAYVRRPLLKKIRINPFVVMNHVLYLVMSVAGWSDTDGYCRIVMRQVTDVNKLIS